uniref:DNA-repair protein Xrcc1 N-terminal domain-containing protein n=1 Tax=Strix occidentalis caurina TaxID=311401 RepID=A0A8D0FUG8_STROC
SGCVIWCLCRCLQDPRYPVENLLREDGPRPWLSCPQDRSRHLRVELQLERASPIGYVDVGNCGCAFLQIEVGRSSWPLNQPYLTLVPSVALMTPADSKLDRNRCGVRMFKEADFLALAVGQKWDRLRLTCSQPFSKHSQFGLSFIRVRTPLDPQHPQPPQQGLPVDSPWRASPAFCRTFFPESHSFGVLPPSPRVPGAPVLGRGLTVPLCLQELEGGGAAQEPPAAAGAGCAEPSSPQPPGPHGAVGGTEPGIKAQNRHSHPGG